MEIEVTPSEGEMPREVVPRTLEALRELVEWARTAGVWPVAPAIAAGMHSSIETTVNVHQVPREVLRELVADDVDAWTVEWWDRRRGAGASYFTVKRTFGGIDVHLYSEDIDVTKEVPAL